MARNLLALLILVLFMAFTQFLGMIIYKRFEKLCEKIKNHFSHRAVQNNNCIAGEQGTPTPKKPVLMEDISSDIPHAD
jgi:hypothetical protein